MTINADTPYSLEIISHITKIPVQELENQIRLGMPSVYDVTSSDSRKLLKLSDVRFWYRVGRFINRGD